MSKESNYQLKAAYFIQDIPIFLNYKNKVTCEEFELTIRSGFLFIKDNKKGHTMLVPLTSVASADLVS
jgi:hypothetical protein